MKKIQKKARQDGKIVKDSEDSEQGNSNKSCKIKEEEHSELPLTFCFVLRDAYAHSTTAIPPQGSLCAFIRHYRDEFLTYERARVSPQRASPTLFVPHGRLLNIMRAPTPGCAGGCCILSLLLLFKYRDESA